MPVVESLTMHNPKASILLPVSCLCILNYNSYSDYCCSTAEQCQTQIVVYVDVFTLLNGEVAQWLTLQELYSCLAMFTHL